MRAIVTLKSIIVIEQNQRLPVIVNLLQQLAVLFAFISPILVGNLHNYICKWDRQEKLLLYSVPFHPLNISHAFSKHA